MKKKLLFIVSAIALTILTGCGSDMSDAVKDSMEWSSENDALDHDKAWYNQAASTEVSDTDTETSEPIYGLGDTVPVTLSYDNVGDVAHVDITITGVTPVFNGVQNCTAVSYTVTQKSTNPFTFKNIWFDMYADSNYISGGNWDTHTIHDYCELREGMSYEGCYIGEVDYNTISSISMFLDNVEWVIPIESVNTETEEDVTPTSPAAPTGDYLDWAGTYTDGISSASISMYSSPEDDSCGEFTGEIEGYGEISCPIEYYPDEGMMLAADETGLVVYCSVNEEGNYLINVDIYLDDGSCISSEKMVMVEHFES